MIDIADIVKNDHAKFHRHYQEILHRNSRMLFTVDQSSIKQDREQGFDYFLSFNKVNVAVRNRSFEYYQRFADFTIRSESKYGLPTEIDKIRNGCGDIYLYVWQNKEGTNLHTYLLVDLEKFRESGLAFAEKRHIRNRDGTKFYSYTIQELFRADCLLALNKFNRQKE